VVGLKAKLSSNFIRDQAGIQANQNAQLVCAHIIFNQLNTVKRRAEN